MAWALVGTPTADFLIGSTASTAQNHVAGHMLVACISGSNSSTVTGITNTAGDTWVQCTSARSTRGTNWTDIWYVPSTAGNASDVVSVTLSGAGDQGSLIILEYSGQAASTPFETAAIGTTDFTSPITTASFSPASAGNLNVAICMPSNQTGTWTAGSGYALRSNEAVADGQVEDNQSASSGAQTASISNGSGASNIFVMSVASFKPLGAVADTLWAQSVM